MAETWARWHLVVVVWALALPAVALLGWLLFRHRTRRRGDRETARRTTLTDLGMIAGTAPWLWMMFTPVPNDRSVDLIPLLDIAEQLRDDPARAAVQAVANLLVFSAYGFFAPIRWRVGAVRVTLVAAAASAVGETLQYVLALGRVSSVDDVLLNGLGAGLAALCSYRWWLSRRAERSTAARRRL